MSCLIYASNSSGCIGRCDANCYNAKDIECDCICGGKNHGVGYKRALENTTRYSKNWIERYAKEHNIDPKDLKLGSDVFQPKLF